MKIYKYTVHAGDNVVSMPQAAKILCVQLQDGEYCLWAEVNEHLQFVQRSVVAYCTGEQFCREGVYISTVQDGRFVVHFYDLGEY